MRKGGGWLDDDRAARVAGGPRSPPRVGDEPAGPRASVGCFPAPSAADRGRRRRRYVESQPPGAVPHRPRAGSRCGRAAIAAAARPPGAKARATQGQGDERLRFSRRFVVRCRGLPMPTLRTCRRDVCGAPPCGRHPRRKTDETRSLIASCAGIVRSSPSRSSRSETNGLFASADELLDVEGVTAKHLRSLRRRHASFRQRLEKISVPIVYAEDEQGESTFVIVAVTLLAFACYSALRRIHLRV